MAFVWVVVAAAAVIAGSFLLDPLDRGPARCVRLYSGSGTLLQEWRTTDRLRSFGDGLTFDVDGQTVTVRGTLTATPCPGGPR